MTKPVRVISSMATRALLVDLVELWNASGGVPVSCESIGGVDAAKRVAAGEPYDVVVLAEEAIDRLVSNGYALADTKTNLVHSSVAIAARQGETFEPIGDEEGLKAAVVSAQCVAVSTGPSGHAIQQLFARWERSPGFKARLVQAPPGVPTGKLVVDRAANLGFQQLSELRDLPGIQVLGVMPPGLEVITTFSAACCSLGTNRDRALEILRCWSSSDVSELKVKHGMDPVLR